MKNIHILPTNKPSRLYLYNGKLGFAKGFQYGTDVILNQNIYITSDDKFVKDEYITDGVEVIKSTPKLVDAQGLVNRRDWKEIILTTDQDLIKDGVQAIDDEFLEWFINNSSCESVETIKVPYFDESGYSYLLIIPKEEPKQETLEEGWNPNEQIMDFKQETLEEVAHEMLIDYGIKSIGQSIGVLAVKKLMVNMAKWQQEQDKKLYSEEVICKNCKKVISVEHINSHLFMAVKSGGLIHWNCKTI